MASVDAFAVDGSRGDELGFVGGGGDVVVARGGVLEDGSGGFGGQIAVVLAGGVEFAVFFTESDASLGHPYLRFDVRAEEVVDERAADVVVALAAQDVVTKARVPFGKEHREFYPTGGGPQSSKLLLVRG